MGGIKQPSRKLLKELKFGWVKWNSLKRNYRKSWKTIFPQSDGFKHRLQLAWNMWRVTNCLIFTTSCRHKAFVIKLCRHFKPNRWESSQQEEKIFKILTEVFCEQFYVGILSSQHRTEKKVSKQQWKNSWALLLIQTASNELVQVEVNGAVRKVNHSNLKTFQTQQNTKQKEEKRNHKQS